MDISRQHMDHIVKHQGHGFNINIHLGNSGQTSDIVERLNVAKLLLIQDEGLVSTHQRKKLENVDIRDLPFTG